MVNLKNILSVTTFAVFMVSLAGAQGKSKESKIELIPVYEKTFDDTIVDVIFDTVTVSIEEAKKMGWKELNSLITKDGFAQVEYPRVLITESQIRFYSSKGTIIKQVPIIKKQRVFRSPSGQYLILTSKSGYDGSGGEIYEWNGMQIGNISKGVILELSDISTALVAEGLPEIGPPVYYVTYDKTGKETGRFKVPERFLNAEGGGAKLTEDGDYFIVGFGMFRKPDTAVYYLVSKSGTVLWQKSFPYSLSGSMPLNHVGRVNLGIVGKWETELRLFVFLIDWEGNLKWNLSLNTGGNFLIRFAEHGDRVFISSTRGYLFCIRAKDGKVLWQHKEDWAPLGIVATHPAHKPLFEDMILIDHGKEVVVNGIKEDNNRTPYASTIFIFDEMAGKLKVKSEYNFPVRLNRSRNSKSCLICKKNSVEVFKTSPRGAEK